jgi:TRAP-type C4-dicarboxylate transport system permease small subunit
MDCISRYLQRLEAGLGAILIGAMFFIISVNTILRYFFSSPIYASDEISSYLFVWSILLASALAIEHDNHVRIGVLFDRMPKQIQRSFLLIQHLLILAVSLSMLASAKNAFLTLGPSPAMQVPEKYIYTILPVTFVLMSLHSCNRIRLIVSQMLDKSKRGKPWGSSVS